MNKEQLREFVNDYLKNVHNHTGTGFKLEETESVIYDDNKNIKLYRIEATAKDNYRMSDLVKSPDNNFTIALWFDTIIFDTTSELEKIITIEYREKAATVALRKVDYEKV